MTKSDGLQRTRAQQIRRIGLRVVVFCCILGGIHFGALWINNELGALNSIDRRRASVGLFAFFLVSYALLLAIPFVPGIEIGIALMAVQGAAAAPMVYLASVLGLLLAYALGRYLPLGWLRATFEDLHMTRAAALVAKTETGSHQDRLDGLRQGLPKRWGGLVLRYRYVMLAVLINTPGTAIIGGGGGILTMAGVTRLFRDGWVVVTVLLATLPVPLAVWVLGSDAVL